MADRAPGQDAPKHEASCYNCGSKDHFVFACPEPTRSQPAGLEAFRQRQAANQMKSSATNSSHGNRSKGPIITRYAPPPGTGASPPAYNPWANGPPPPPGPAPYSHSAPPGLPSQPAGYPPLPPGPPTPYTPYPPTPAPQGAYGQSYPPVVPPPVYSQYGPPGPPGPPPQPTPPPYGQSNPYGPPVYGQPYAPPPSSPYPPAPQPYYSGPSPPAYPSYAPPPPNNYQQVPYNAPNGPPYTTDPQYPPSLPPPPPAHWNQASGNRNQHHNRGSRHNRDHRGRGQRHHGQQKQSSDSNRRSSSAAKDSPIRSISTPKSDQRDEHATPIDDDFEWELEKIFLEVNTKDADPVGRPLPPEYNDDPTIPPAFNAKCIKSEFFSETDLKSFSISIRDTTYWGRVRDDPAFKHYRGMIKIRFPGYPHEYSTYDLAHLQSDPSDDEPTHSSQEGQSRAKRTFEETREDQERELKRHKYLPGPAGDMSRSKREGGSRSAERDVTDTLFHSLHDQVDRVHPRQKDDRSNAPHESTLRHDSGYQSAQSGDRRQDPRRERSSNQNSPPQPDYRRSRSSSRPRSRDHSPGARKMPAYSRSYDNEASDSDDSSQMSDIEYELLGLDRPTKKEKKKESKQTPKRRRVKVNDAFSRRW